MLPIGNKKAFEANQSQKLTDGAKKNCQILLNPNVPGFLPWKAAFYVKNKFVQQTYPVFKPGQKFPTYRAVLVDDLPEAENFGIVPALDAFKELEHKFVLEAKEVCQYCLVNTNNHFRGNNCLPRTDLSTSGYGSDDHGSSGYGFSGCGSSGCGSSGYCSSGYGASGYLSSDEEYLTPIKSVKRDWSENREVAATEEFYKQTYFRNNHNQMDNVWLESNTGDFSPPAHTSPGIWDEMDMTLQITEESYNQTRINSNHMDNVWLESNTEDFSPRIWVKDTFYQSWSTASLD